MFLAKGLKNVGSEVPTDGEWAGGDGWRRGMYRSYHRSGREGDLQVALAQSRRQGEPRSPADMPLGPRGMDRRAAKT